VTEYFVDDLADTNVQAVDLTDGLRQDLADGLRRAAAVRSEKEEKE
jgi:hypothetical protein